MKPIKMKTPKVKVRIPDDAQSTGKLTLPFGVNIGDVLTINSLDGRIHQQVIVTDSDGSKVNN